MCIGLNGLRAGATVIGRLRAGESGADPPSSRLWRTRARAVQTLARLGCGHCQRIVPKSSQIHPKWGALDRFCPLLSPCVRLCPLGWGRGREGCVLRVAGGEEGMLQAPPPSPRLRRAGKHPPPLKLRRASQRSTKTQAPRGSKKLVYRFPSAFARLCSPFCGEIFYWKGEIVRASRERLPYRFGLGGLGGLGGLRSVYVRFTKRGFGGEKGQKFGLPGLDRFATGGRANRTGAPRGACRAWV